MTRPGFLGSLTFAGLITALAAACTGDQSGAPVLVPPTSGASSVVGNASPTGVGPTTETVPAPPPSPVGMPGQPDDASLPPAQQKATAFMAARPISGGTLLILSN